VGDLNGDGFEDLVVNNGAQELLNKGDGTFNPAVTLPTECELPGPDPTRCLAGAALIDMNGDGKLDLIQTDSVNNVVTVSLGNGDGSFQSPQVYPFPPEGGGGLFIEDFNQDGKPDVVLAGSTFFGVYLNDGLGNLLPPQILEGLVGGGSGQGDFNGDGLTDIFGMPTYNLQPGAIFLLGQTAMVQLNNVVLPASGASLEASYSGDEAFAKSISNVVQLTGTGLDFAGGFAGSGSTLQLNGGVSVVGAVLQLTNGGFSEAGSAFAKVPVNIQSFTTDFTFQILNPAADGFTFAIQNAGPNAIGGSGSGLGYFGIPKSVAIKFDLHNNAGEGPDSAGLYVDGARPTVPAIDLSGTGIDLHSGDVFHAHITYDGVNLTMTLTDTVTLATSSHSWPIDIPGTVGGNAAWVGFTGATGAKTSAQEILTWTFVHL
jgi:Legume lectin domain/FG-GAP-like repeat